MSSPSRFAVSLAVVLIAAAILITSISEAQEQTGFMSQGGTADLITLVPRTMTYQGLLKDDLGDPIANETLNITFRIYNDPDAGYLRWDETVEITTDDGGYFDATLTDVNLPFNEDYWLELEIDSEILDPRQKINMVGYAAVSDTADYASESGSLTLPYSKTISSPYTAFSITNTNGTGGHFEGGGFGLRAAADDGIAVWGESDNALLPAVLGSNHGNAMGLIGVSEGTGYGVFGQGDLGVGVYGLSSDGFAGYFNGDVYASGKVGIGTTDPFTALDVDGSAQVSGNINVSGSAGVNGHLTVNDYMNTPFPRPAYNSGWFYLAPDHDTTLHHNLGGDAGDYFIDFQQKSLTSNTITNNRVGGDSYQVYYFGAYYSGLDPSSVMVHRYANNVVTDQFRVRIWIIK